VANTNDAHPREVRKIDDFSSVKDAQINGRRRNYLRNGRTGLEAYVLIAGRHAYSGNERLFAPGGPRRGRAAWSRSLAACLIVLLPVAAVAGQSERGQSTGLPAVVPAAPLPPEVITRDAQGRVTIRATRLRAPLVVDGRLDEEIYKTVPSFGDFIQQEPHEGQPSTEKSEVWVFFDDDNIYVSARFWFTHPEDIIAKEMRRDDGGIIQRDDNIGLMLDTFFDHRSGYYLNTNAVGGVRDASLTNENINGNMDYDLVWTPKSRRFDKGWTTEIAIPFKSLNYPARREQVWGILVQRIDQKKNEYSYVTRVPASYGPAGIWKVSSEATLVGIEAPVHGGRLDVKPYALSSLTTNRQATPAISNAADGNVGIDAAYKITKSLNADFTYNTDFAQVEVDNQQVNLTRFSLFYPEKREFFLSTQGIFNFGAVPGGPSFGPVTGVTPILFFSRQIGLTNGVTVPIEAGGRLSGRAGPYTIGALSIRTQESAEAQAPATTFNVVRLRRNLFGRSTIGVLATDREPSNSNGLFNAQTNRLVGADASFRFLQDVEVNGQYSRSQTKLADGTSVGGDEENYLGQFRYSADRYGAEITQLKVGNDFNPGIGFLPRKDFVENYAQLRFSPRPKDLLGIRKFTWQFTRDAFASTEGVRQTVTDSGYFQTAWNNGDNVSATFTHTDDRPLTPFFLVGATIAPGAYQFDQWNLNYGLGPNRPTIGNASIQWGTYYGGHKTQLSYFGVARVHGASRFLTEPNVTVNWLDLPQGSFTSKLIGGRFTFTMTPRMLVAALLQYNSTAHNYGQNIRFRWEYVPGSDLFVVYTDGRDTEATTGSPMLLNRSFAVKFTHLFRM
jgi:hypothetical protein